MTTYRYPITGCGPDGLEIDLGHRLDCCGCELTVIGVDGPWRDCSCRCHESARHLMGLAPLP